jgi:TRAP-type C4-dicarboxylate transport system permease small subunit
MLDNWMVWLSCLEIVVGLLVIACGALIRGNLLGIQVNATFRLAVILIGTGLLLGSCSNVLSDVERSTWSTVDRNHLSWAESILGIFCPLLILIALFVMSRYRDQLQSRAQNEQAS